MASPSPTPIDVVEIALVRWRIVMAAAACVAFAVLGLVAGGYLAVQAVDPSSDARVPISMFIAVLSVAIGLAALATWEFIRWLRDPSPGLTIDLQGLRGHAAIFPGFVPWSDVLWLEQHVDANGFRWLLVYLKDTSAWLAPGTRRRPWYSVSPLNPIRFRPSLLDIDPAVLVSILNDLARAHRRPARRP